MSRLPLSPPIGGDDLPRKVKLWALGQRCTEWSDEFQPGLLDTSSHALQQVRRALHDIDVLESRLEAEREEYDLIGPPSLSLLDPEERDIAQAVHEKRIDYFAAEQMRLLNMRKINSDILQGLVKTHQTITSASVGLLMAAVSRDIVQTKMHDSQRAERDVTRRVPLRSGASQVVDG